MKCSAKILFWKTSQNSRENIFDKVFLSKIAGLLASNDNIKESVTDVFLSICEILWNSYFATKTPLEKLQTVVVKQFVIICNNKKLICINKNNLRNP